MLCAALLVFTVTAGVSAVPYYGYGHRYHEPLYHPPPPPSYHPDYMPSPAFGSDMFDTRQFWLDLSREMMSIDQMITDLHSRFPSVISSSEYIGNTYKIVIPLTGFEEKEITVKAKNSLLMVQAVHKGNVDKTYVDARTLPANVEVNGTWTYDGKVLVIVFPVKESTDEENNSAGQDSTETDVKTDAEKTGSTETVNKNVSREEMETNRNEDNVDADVGLNTKNSNTRSDEEIETNSVSTVAPILSTTYAVDLSNNDVEFVPIRY